MMTDDKVNILVLEDEAIVAMSLEDTLQRQGYQVTGPVDTGREALEIVRTKPVDLALLDIHVRGEWDGVKTAQMILAERNIPFIFLTAFSDRETINRAKDTAPSAYLVKPYQPQSLFIAIDLAMHNYYQRKTFGTPAAIAGPREKSHVNELKDEVLVFNESVFIKQGYSYLKVLPAEISHLEVSGNHTWIFTQQKKYVVRAGLQSILDRPGLDLLVRVHRSFAINIRQVTSFNAASVFIGDHEIPVSRMFRDAFFASLKQN